MGDYLDAFPIPCGTLYMLPVLYEQSNRQLRWHQPQMVPQQNNYLLELALPPQ